jgi:hypothetical protein
MARVPENGFCIPRGVICFTLRERVGPGYRASYPVTRLHIQAKIVRPAATSQEET